MANLLTSEAKKKIVYDWRLRQLVVALGLISVWLLVAVIFNLALWFNFNIQKGPFLSQFLSNNTSEAEEVELQQAKNRIGQLAKWWPKSLWTEAIIKIENLRPDTIKIYHLAGIFSEKDQTLSLALAGQASKRQDLVDFAEQLRQDNFFEQVDLPVESLLLTSNGQFTLNLILKNDY